MRHPEWPERLTAYLSEIRSRPYHPVTHNCALFALGALQAVTGRPAQEFLQAAAMDLPDTEMGVKRAIVENGDMRAIASRALGPISKATLNARRGDIALMEGDGGDTLAIVENGAALVLTPQGIQRHPLTEALGYWNV